MFTPGAASLPPRLYGLSGFGCQRRLKCWPIWIFVQWTPHFVHGRNLRLRVAQVSCCRTRRSVCCCLAYHSGLVRLLFGEHRSLKNLLASLRNSAAIRSERFAISADTDILQPYYRSYPLCDNFRTLEATEVIGKLNLHSAGMSSFCTRINAVILTGQCRIPS
jgi:hypothetical protein